VLGVPNVADRIAPDRSRQACWRRSLSRSSTLTVTAYRRGASALDAVAVTKKRCHEKDWVVDLDIRAFFDSVSHDLLMKAVAHHTDEAWVLL